jgi:hypothetical protein
MFDEKAVSSLYSLGTRFFSHRTFTAARMRLALLRTTHAHCGVGEEAGSGKGGRRSPSAFVERRATYSMEELVIRRGTGAVNESL